MVVNLLPARSIGTACPRAGLVTEVVRCPRCSARKIEGVDTCPRCQWRFEPTTKSTRDAWARPPTPTSETTSQRPSREPAVTPAQVRIEPWDTKTIARASASMMQVRCIGTAGGCLGFAVGGFLGLMIGSATGSFALAIVGAPIGAFAGALIAIFLTLKLLARD